MEFKVISKEQLEKLYPNHYDTVILKSYALMDWKLNTAFQYYYSCYHFYLDLFLKEELKLNDFNEEIANLNYIENVSNLYHDISSLNLEYIFVRNNIFLDRLTQEEFAAFKDYYEKKDEKKLKEFVQQTYKKLIIFDINRSAECTVNYEFSGFITANNALVIGVLGKSTKDLQNLIKIKEVEYTKILNIPVSIFIYENDDLEQKVEMLKNLNLVNENNQKEILKKYPKFLPLGSVVTLKNGYKKLMIMGYSPIDMDKKDAIYDYLGCFYPEGVIHTKINILFNHDNIKCIHSIGLIDDEQRNFMGRIDELIGSEEQKKEVLKKVNEQ